MEDPDEVLRRRLQVAMDEAEQPGADDENQQPLRCLHRRNHPHTGVAHAAPS